VSDFTAIRGVSRTLQAILREHITDDGDPQLAGVTIDMESPKEMREANRTGVSLWLYRVTRNEHILNQPPQRVARDQVLRHPLPINLYYLVTPFTDDPVDEQALLGRVLQTFNDHNIVRGSDLQDSLQGGVEELRIALEPLSLEELTRIWHALQEPYQLSVTYQIQMISIESAHQPLHAAPVERKETTYMQILESHS
jgi:hypothetical protein